MVRLLVSVLLLLTCMIAGCGVYTFNPSGKSDIEAISIKRFENQTVEYELADRMTDLVIDAFISDGSMKVVSSENSDALLEGTLVRYELRPFEYTTEDEVISYAVVMDFSIVLKKSSDDTEIWSERMGQEGVYEVATETEEDGQEKAIALLIDAIINRTTRSW